VSITVTWRVLRGACELIQISVCKEKTEVIVLTILGVTLWHFVTRKTRLSRFGHPSTLSLHMRVLEKISAVFDIVYTVHRACNKQHIKQLCAYVIYDTPTRFGF
jgi:hypothetical protein